MRYVLTFLCTLLTMSAPAQDFAPQIVNIPENPGTADFSFLREELKNTQVVMLGEISHFDGNVFEMKTKIVEYLVKEMGYTTIAFESGIYDVWDAQKKISAGGDVKTALQNSLFPIWAKTAEFRSFINFFEANKNTLKLFGFDNQITGTSGAENLVKDLYAYCKRNKLKLNLDADDLSLLLESITRSGMFDEEDISFQEYTEVLSQLHTKILVKPASEEKFYWQHIVKSLLALGEDTKNTEEILSTFSTTAFDNVRDRQMAGNLLAYIELHPREKIICWGANQHFVNDMSSITAPVLKEFVPMGSYVKRELKDKLYSLAAITATDSVYLQNQWHDTPVQPNSFEAFLKNQKIPFYFISASQTSMNEICMNRFFSPITFVEANLSQLHDGYLYFDKAIPATPIESEDESVAIYKPVPDEAEEALPATEGVEAQNTTMLKEVVVYAKKTPYLILDKAIENQNLNYPDTPFSSTLYTNVVSKIENTTILDFDFIAGQYDRGYVSHTNRSAKTIKEIKWNTKSFYEPQTLREYHGLVYNSPIQYVPLLKKRKFKKFDLILEEVTTINGEEVYVISFSSARNHSTYTRRVFLSNYSGYVYINKDDYAVVKLLENWEVTEFPESFSEGYGFKGDYSKYIKKEYGTESTLTEFTKVNGLYYLSFAANHISGKIIDDQNNSLPFDTFTESHWYDFRLTDPIKISYKEEQHLFEMVKYNEKVWEEYNFPK